MFGSKIAKVIDDVFDFQGEFPEIKFNEDELYVDDHWVTVNVEKFSKNLVASIKYVLLELMPTKRLVVAEENINTSDEKVISSDAVRQLMMAKVSSDCPYDSFRLNVQYNDKAVFDPVSSKTFKFINMRDIEMFNEDAKQPPIKQKYINESNFCAIEFGKYISINGRIEEHNSFSANSIYKYITTEFKRDLTIGKNNVTEYYDGSFSFHYIDNRSGVQVLTKTFEILIDIIESIQNSQEMIRNVLGGCIVEVPFDRSGVISYLIDVYILMETKTKVLLSNKNSQNGKTLMSFENISSDDLSVILNKSLKSLHSELKSLIKDLK